MGSTQGGPVWQPTPQQVEDANITAFARFVAGRRGLEFNGYDSLWDWSTSQVAQFWSDLWEFFDLGPRVDTADVLGGTSMRDAHWFSTTHVNFAQTLLTRGRPDGPAIITVGEGGDSVELSWEEMRTQVESIASALRIAGVETGDRVVGYLPNIAEAVVAFLATAWIGAIWSSVGQDYAPSAAVDRFSQLEPKVMVTADGYRFAGKEHPRLEQAQAILGSLPTVQSVILIDRIGADDAPGSWLAWSDLVQTAGACDAAVVPFSHPLWVLFSSGTTGIPKGLVHSHGGILIEMVKQMGLHWDLRRDDRVFWFTSPSWVMWNLQLSTLTVGGSIVCYDGAPTYPGPSTLWQVVSDHEVTFFGSSPGFLQATLDAGIRPHQQFDLTSLRAMGSTGSPLPPHLHRWCAEDVGAIPLYSMSGGTDIAGAFCGGVPTVAIWPGELAVRCLGVAIDAWDGDGHPVRGQVGEMVITEPMPSMPIHLWNDPDGERYRKAYFSMFPNAWRQGDWITLTERNSIVIHGRSDSTLNRNGVRMGSADIYSAIDERVPQIHEALVIGAEMPDGSYWMPLFVVLEDGETVSAELVAQISAAIREGASPRHVPDTVIQVRGIPHTKTGKKLEVPVKRILQGADVSTVVKTDAVDDPSLLAEYVEIAATHLTV